MISHGNPESVDPKWGNNQPKNMAKKNLNDGRVKNIDSYFGQQRSDSS